MSALINRSPVARWLVSLTVLALLAWWLDPAAVVGQMAQISPAWVAAGLALSGIQTVLSAWRWRFTARRLGLTLSWRRALGDYYLAMFINQVLPGGVAGDALRAHRHAGVSGETGPSWRAVIIERASGQFVVLAFVIALFVLDPFWRGVLWRIGHSGASAWGWLVPLVLLLAVGLTAAAFRWPAQWRRFRGDAYSSLLAPAAWPAQLVASIGIVATYALVFAFAARGIGVDVDLLRLTAVALPILLSMLVPFSVAGWGFREALASSVWIALGLPAEQGAAVAVTYGLVVLLASSPGALMLALRPASRDRQRPGYAMD